MDHHPLCHRRRLLHRSDCNFFMLGATGNVYKVTLSSTPSCTCPDPTIPCNHILFVLIQVLGVSLDDVCLRRRTLRPCELHRLLGTPTSREALAGPTLRQRFHQQFSEEGALVPIIEIEEGSRCPICLEEMGMEERVVACGTCENPVHEECMVKWKRSRGKRWARCVICRAKWRDKTEQDKYLNLSAYIIEGDMTQPKGVSLLPN